MRLFIGIPLEDKLRADIVNHYHRFQPLGVIKMVEKENLHITLNFLGDAAPEKIEGIKKAIDESAREVESFFITTNLIASFGSEKYARVIWFNVDKNGEKVIDIFDAIEEKLLLLGFAREEKGFVPHITIARSKEGVDMRKALRDLKFEYKSKVDRVVLYASKLSPAGPEYTILHEKHLSLDI
jgi:RNA 2',3'-cyclic 3'-phosphodiesterase